MNTNTAKNIDPQPGGRMIDPFSGQAFRVIEGGLSSNKSSVEPSEFENEMTAAFEEILGKSPDLPPRGMKPLNFKDFIGPNDIMTKFVIKAIERYKSEHPEKTLTEEKLVSATEKAFEKVGIGWPSDAIEQLVKVAIETYEIQQDARKKVAGILPLGVARGETQAAAA